MPVKYCDICDRYIDLDEDVEHFEMHENYKNKLGGNMNYIVEFQKEVRVEAKNEGEAMALAFKELKEQMEKKDIQKIFNAYPEEY